MVSTLFGRIVAIGAVGLFVGPALYASAARAAEQPGDLTVLTYNIRGAKTDPDNPTGMKWIDRRAATIAKIDAHAPDIFGVQEASRNGDGSGDGNDAAVDLISAFSGGYGSYPSTNPEPGGPKIIFFDSTRFSLVRANQLPIYSPAAGAACTTPRYMTWVLLDDSVTGGQLFVGNAHLPVGTGCEDAKLTAAKKIRSTIAVENTDKVPTVMMGDMNNKPAGCFADPNDPKAAPLKWLTAVGETGINLKKDAPGTECTGTTNSSWPGEFTSGNRLDHILTSQEISVLSRTVDRGAVTISGVSTTPSDHTPVITVLRAS